MADSFVKQSVRKFREGGVVVFPTDTVWGIGAAVNREDAIRRLYSIKRREKNKPTAVLVSGLTMASEYGVIKGQARKLAKEHWPGGLTVVVPARRGKVCEIVSGGGGTVGLRVPKHDFLLRILKKLGSGIVAGSANFAGELTPGKFDEISNRLIKVVDFVVDPFEVGGGLNIEAGGQKPSTVVDCTVVPFKILRRGQVDLIYDN